MRKAQAATTLTIIILGSLLTIVIAISGCSINTAKYEYERQMALEEQTRATQFEYITDANNFLQNTGIKTCLIYDKETKIVYYFCKEDSKFDIMPYIKNGHYTYFDLDNGEIKEI